MERRINQADVLRDFEGILRNISENENKIVIERGDQPVAVIVPVTVYWQWLTSREDHAEKVRRIAEEQGMSAEEAEVNEIVEEAKWWIRGQHPRD